MIGTTLYAVAGALTLAYILAWTGRSEDRVIITNVAVPALKQIRATWGPFTTYLCAVTCAIAVSIGLVAIWPLTLLMRFMVNARRAEMKKEETSAPMPLDVADQLRWELELLKANRKLIDDVITEHEKKLAVQATSN
jgi:hypothetical protein